MPSSHLPVWDTPASQGAGGPHWRRQRPRCRGPWCCARLPADNIQVFFIFKALLALTFILAPPQPAWEVSAITAPSHSPGGAGTRPSSAARCRSWARREGRAARLAWCWLRHRGESRRPGLCRDLPDPSAAPAVPAGPRADTPRHGTHGSHWHPVAWHHQRLLSCRHPRVPAPSRPPPPRETATHTASKAQRFNKTGCVTVIIYRSNIKKKQ